MQHRLPTERAYITMKRTIVALCWSALFLLSGCTTMLPSAATSPLDAAQGNPANNLETFPVNTVANAPVPPMSYFIAATPTPLTLTLPAPRTTPTPVPSPTPVVLDGPVQLLLTPRLPDGLAAAMTAALTGLTDLDAANGPQPFSLTDDTTAATTLLAVTSLADAQSPLLERYYAVVAPFATVRDDVAWNEVQLRWAGLASAPLFIADAAPELLTALLGPARAPVVPRAELLDALENSPDALALVPFEQIDPRMKVLTVAGQDVLDNRLDPRRYPLAVALTAQGAGGGLLAELLRPAATEFVGGYTNRDPGSLTTLIMTGVTAMARGTAARMEREGAVYPAAVISDTLAAADITHVSNEIPFLDDCVVNNTVDNLVLCSHTSYWAALEAIGTDIVGLSGNHVNDFGRDGARESLAFYRDNNIPIYGSGLTVAEACAPLLWEHNGNTFAFIAALAFGPSTAWVTDEEPGACYFYDHKDEILATVREMAQQVDIVAVELQYLEIYEPRPTAQQVSEFRELRAAGADIVTGVQSHVPQAQEPYGLLDDGGPGMISYGLGNLFFDQMWSWETRTELMARHTIYAGRLLNTEILTAVLEDYAQPRWADAEERAEILTRIFRAAPPRP